MAELWATYNLMNEEVLVAESIRSVKAYVDGFVFVDVAYHSYHGTATHSIDDTREEAEAAAAPVPVRYLESDRRMFLPEARNMALSMVPGGGWAFTIDGDETLVGEHDRIEALVAGIHDGTLTDPQELLVYTSALLFYGTAPEIDAEAYRVLPVVHSGGLQPRIYPVRGVEWARAEDRITYGLRRDGMELRGQLDAVGQVVGVEGMLLVNHRTRQTYEAYQGDFVWENIENEPEP